MKGASDLGLPASLCLAASLEVSPWIPFLAPTCWCTEAVSTHPCGQFQRCVHFMVTDTPGVEHGVHVTVHAGTHSHHFRRGQLLVRSQVLKSVEQWGAKSPMYGGACVPHPWEGLEWPSGFSACSPIEFPPRATPDLTFQGAFRAYQGLEDPVPSSVPHGAKTGI